MPHENISRSFARSPLLLTEGAVGQRIEREYGLAPDKDIMYAALVYDKKGRKALAEIYGRYLQTAQDYALPMLLMTNTRRANKERMQRSAFAEKNVMRDYADFLKDISSGFRCEAYVGGMMGCKNDAYAGDEGLPYEEALNFHAWQADMVRDAPVDYLFAAIMPAKDEATAMANVMEGLGKPYIMSLMIHRNGALLDGTSMHDAIVAIDGNTGRKPLCYMTNCVHPAILKEALAQPFNHTATVRERFCGIQANAACSDPEKLDGCETLQTTTAVELANAFESLLRSFPLKILGGCCGTDHTHIREIANRFAVTRRA